MKTAQNTPLEKAARIIQGMIDEATRTNVSKPRFRATLKQLWVKEMTVTFEGCQDEIYRGPGRVKAVIEFSTLKEFQDGFKKWFPKLGNDLLDKGWDCEYNDLIFQYLGGQRLTKLSSRRMREWQDGDTMELAYTFSFKVQRIGGKARETETLDEEMESIFGIMIQALRYCRELS